jgi:broad specificity phosphatase PhoE
MTLVAFIRHGDTDWNRRGLIQGSSDIGLDEEGRALVSGWQVPDALAGFDWISSPLKRARDTARILAGHEPPTDPRLAEMCWGAWEGRTIPDLRSELGDLMKAWEARGLDFCGPDGESPRQVQARVSEWLIEIARAARPVVAVSHRGVIRAVYALATGWDMVGRPPERLSDDCAHVFALDDAARPSVHSLNLPLVPQ